MFPSLFKLEYLLIGASELSLQLPYLLVELLLESSLLLNASLQLDLTEPFSNLDVPFPFSVPYLLELVPFSVPNLLELFPFSYLLEAVSNLETLSPLSVLAVLTGLLLVYLGRDELESLLEVRLLLQLGLEVLE